MVSANLFTAGHFNQFPRGMADAAPLSTVNRGKRAADFGGSQVLLMARRKRTESERTAVASPEPDTRQLILQLQAEMRELGQMMKPAPSPAVAPLKTLAEIVAEFMPRKRLGMGHPGVFEARLRNHVIPALGAHTAATMRPMHVQDMMHSLTHRGRSAQTVNHVRDGGRQLVEFAIDNGLWPAPNPFLKVPQLELPEKNPVMITKSEAAAMLRAVRTRLAPLIAFALYLGPRRDTIFNVRVADVSLERGLVQLLKTKTGKKILDVPIPDELMPFMRAAVASAKGEWLFVSRNGKKRTRDSGKGLNREIKRALRAAGVLRNGEPPHLTFRGLRRLSASFHQEALCHPWVCSKILGHSQAALVAAGNMAENMTAKSYTYFSEQFVRQELNKLRFHGE